MSRTDAGWYMADGSGWWMVLDGGLVPKIFSDFHKNFFIWSSQHINEDARHGPDHFGGPNPKSGFRPPCGPNMSWVFFTVIYFENWEFTFWNFQTWETNYRPKYVTFLTLPWEIPTVLGKNLRFRLQRVKHLPCWRNKNVSFEPKNYDANKKSHFLNQRNNPHPPLHDLGVSKTKGGGGRGGCLERKWRKSFLFKLFFLITISKII